MKITHKQIQAVREMPTGREKTAALIALLAAARGSITEAVAAGYSKLAQGLVS